MDNNQNQTGTEPAIIREPRYRAACVTCGQLSGKTWRFYEDAEGEALKHQEAKTIRIMRHSPLDPDHAPIVKEVK